VSQLIIGVPLMTMSAAWLHGADAGLVNRKAADVAEATSTEELMDPPSPC
jgi:hypothetical protein